MPHEGRVGCAASVNPTGWGDLAAEERAANDAAIQAEERIVSAYVFGDRKLWIITEAVRACTTLLLPEEH